VKTIQKLTLIVYQDQNIWIVKLKFGFLLSTSTNHSINP